MELWVILMFLHIQHILKVLRTCMPMVYSAYASYLGVALRKITDNVQTLQDVRDYTTGCHRVTFFNSFYNLWVPFSDDLYHLGDISMNTICLWYIWYLKQADCHYPVTFRWFLCIYNHCNHSSLVVSMTVSTSAKVSLPVGVSSYGKIILTNYTASYSSAYPC